MKKTLFWDPPSEMKRPAEALCEFLAQTGFTMTSAAKEMGVSRGTLSRILAGGNFDADMALRIGSFTGTGGSVWIYSQAFWQLHDAYTGKTQPCDTRIRVDLPEALSNLKVLGELSNSMGVTNVVARKLWPLGPPGVFTPKFRVSKEVSREA